MNLIVGAPSWLVAFLFLCLIAAAIEDAIRLRISNVTCVAVIVGAIVSMAVHGFSTGLWQNAVVFVAILAIGTALFSAGWLGGGDVKLFAALGLWVDLQAALGLVVAIMIAGGFLAAIYLVWWRVTRREKGRESRRLPYGLAILAGTLFIFGVQLTARASNPYVDQLRAERAANR